MIIAIASGKGGTGKTTLAVNLAAYLSATSKVCLADLDVEEPNSGIFLGGNLLQEKDIFKYTPQWLEDTCIQCGKCQEVCRFNAVLNISGKIMIFKELCHSCYACSELCPTSSLPMKEELIGHLSHRSCNENLETVDSCLEIGQISAVPLIASTLSYLDNSVPDKDLFIFDSPPGTSCPMIEVTRSANYVILVTEPTPFGFHDLKLALKTMQKLNKPFGIVINRSGSGYDKTISDYCHDHDYPVITSIPYLKKAAQLYSEGELLYKEIPRIEFSLRQICEYLDLV